MAIFDDPVNLRMHLSVSGPTMLFGKKSVQATVAPSGTSMMRD